MYNSLRSRHRGLKGAKRPRGRQQMRCRKKNCGKTTKGLNNKDVSDDSKSLKPKLDTQRGAEKQVEHQSSIWTLFDQIGAEP